MLYMEPLIIITIVFGVLILTLGIFIIILGQRIKNLSAGNNGLSLEAIIIENNKMIKLLAEKQAENAAGILYLNTEALNHIQGVGVVRFNPFKEMGGSQSFAVALTDKKNNGVVISSLYGRDRVNVFAKPITNGGSEYTLTKEEEQAIKKSQN